MSLSLCLLIQKSEVGLLVCEGGQVLLIIGGGSPGEHLVPPPPPADLCNVGASEHNSDQLHNGKQHTNSRINWKVIIYMSDHL